MREQLKLNLANILKIRHRYLQSGRHCQKQLDNYDLIIKKIFFSLSITGDKA